MGSGIKIGKIFGIEISIDYSWFIIFLLVTWSFATSFFPIFFPLLGLGSHILLGIATSIILFLSVVIHEVAHSLVARKNGLEINKISLFIFGGASQISDEPPTPKAEFLMAIAGPLTSIVLGLLFILSSILVSKAGNSPLAVGLLSILGNLNIVLGLFNLLPGFPLDGGRVFRSVVWYFTHNLEKATKIAMFGGYIIGWGLVTLGIVEILVLGTFSGFWLVLVGLFLNLAASQSYQQVIIRKTLSGVTIDKLMSQEVVIVPPDLAIDDFINDYLLKYHYSSFPVTRNEKIVGIISLNNVRTINRDKWDSTKVKEIMIPYSKDLILKSDDKVSKALNIMNANNITKMPIVDTNEMLIGIITQNDILRYLSLHMDV